MTSLLDLYKILNTICFCSFLLGDKDKEIHNLSDCELENMWKSMGLIINIYSVFFFLLNNIYSVFRSLYGLTIQKVCRSDYSKGLIEYKFDCRSDYSKGL
jgi:hypothetical protein